MPMNFIYQLVLGYSAETGELTAVLRPEIPILVTGPKRTRQFQALVDTGTDYTVLPKSVADDCGIPTAPGNGPPLKVFGGESLKTSFGDVQFELRQENVRIRWNARVQFFDFPSAEDESLLLGHVGFLDYFDATFQGQQGMLTLVPVDEQTLSRSVEP
jgi:predicted aspartyl protease